MRRCRGEWLPAPYIISVLLFLPMACGRLLIGASDTSPPPALTPTFIKQVDDWVSKFSMYFIALGSNICTEMVSFHSL